MIYIVYFPIRIMNAAISEKERNTEYYNRISILYSAPKRNIRIEEVINL